MAIKTRRVNHPGIIGQDRDEMVKFYSEVLNMPLVLDHTNLDKPRMQHFFFDAGNGGFIAYFVINESTDIELPKAKDGMCPIDRTYKRSVYFKDPNGVLVELLTRITPLPEGAAEAEVVARATALRGQEGAHRIEDDHVRRAMQEMGYALESQ